MTTILLFLGMAFASDPIERPATPEPVKGECFKVVPINKGKPLSPVILDTDGIAKCSALAVPLSQFSDLLQTEQWLDMEIDWYKTKLEQANQPVPWVEKPATQRWLGRIETIVVVGIVTAGLGATYHYSSGVGQ
mgnify:CR=1 FL=1